MSGTERLAGLLGPHPETFDAVLAGLVRLHRVLVMDAEEEQSRPAEARAARASRSLLLLLMAWIRPAAEEQREAWATAEADERRAAEEAWQALREQGLSEPELRELSGR